MTKRDKNEKKWAAEQGYLASIKVDDLVRPVDPRTVEKQKHDTQKGFLHEQFKEKAKAQKEGDGKFFGMTDEEILLNQEYFRKMGLMS